MSTKNTQHRKALLLSLGFILIGTTSALADRDYFNVEETDLILYDNDDYGIDVSEEAVYGPVNLQQSLNDGQMQKDKAHNIVSRMESMPIKDSQKNVFKSFKEKIDRLFDELKSKIQATQAKIDRGINEREIKHDQKQIMQLRKKLSLATQQLQMHMDKALHMKKDNPSKENPGKAYGKEKGPEHPSEKKGWKNWSW